MKRTIEQGQVETSGVGEINQFKMLVNEKSFSIIISGIYSDKIKAIIREYGCNAVDSHKEAGHAKPFDVHLPSYENPNFYIRDYGVGLDEEDIINVFTVAFVSTKENSNLCTGMLGIGAMSGFCYNTMSFTVTSWKNGKKYIYHCFLGDAGVPSYTKLLEEDSKEPTGVKVEFPAGNDIYAFERKAIEVFRWFDIKPNFVGNTKVVLPSTNPKFKGNKWFVAGDNKRCRLLMGNVLYDVDEGDVALQKYATHINMDIIIEAPMGSVDFQPSRERLQYTPKTVAFLRKTFINITKEVGEVFEKKIKDAESLWQARKIFHRLTTHDMSDLIRLIDDYSTIKWNGEKISDGKSHKIKLDEKDDLEVYVVRTFERYYYRQTARETSKRDISPFSDQEIFINDLKRGEIGRIKYFLSTQDDVSQGFMFIPCDGKTEQDVRDYLKKKLGCLDKDIKNISSLEEPPKNTTYRRGKLGKISTWKDDYRVTRCWEEKDFGDEDIETGDYYYVERKGYNFINNFSGAEERPNVLSRFHSFMEKELGKAITIYGVASKELGNLPSNWIEFTKEVNEKLQKNKSAAQSYLDYITYTRCVNDHYNSTKYKYLEKAFKSIKHDLKKDHTLVKWLENKEKLITAFPKVSKPTNFEYVSSFFGLSSPEVKVDFCDYYWKSYPLLDFLSDYMSYYSYGIDTKKYVTDSEILNYIRGVDNGKNL